MRGNELRMWTLREYDEKLCEVEAELDKHRWIPVEERLPEIRHGILICSHGLTHIAYMAGADKFYSSGSGGWVPGVTHWKPIILPKE